MVSRDGQEPKISHYGVKTVFIGWPNAGKSSLFNKLLNRSKAIVTQVRGTTRDTLEADMVLEGIHFRMKDTAGVTCGKDELESLIAQRTYGSMDDAQIVLFVIDGSVGLCSQQIELFGSIAAKNKIIVINKTDLKQSICYENLPSQMKAFPVINTSVLTGEGLDALKKTIVSSISVDTGLFSHALSNPDKILLRSKLILLPSFFITLTGLSSTLSYVVDRLPQFKHSLLRFTLNPSVDALELITLSSSILQNRHFIMAYYKKYHKRLKQYLNVNI
jgi:small GTP-binding protein